MFGRHLGKESSIGTPFLWIDRSQIVPINLISAILFYDIPLKGSNWVSQLAVDISHHLFFTSRCENAEWNSVYIWSC